MSETIENIKRLKAEKKITAKELSLKSGVPVGTLNKILSSKTKSIKSETLEKIYSALSDNLSFKILSPLDNSDKGFLRVASVSPQLFLGDSEKTLGEIKFLIRQANELGSDVICFPELCLSGYTLSDLFYTETVLKNSLKTLYKIIDFSINYEMLVVVGMPIIKSGKLYNVAVVLAKGKILGFVPKTNIPEYNEFYEARFFSPSDDENSTICLNGEN